MTSEKKAKYNMQYNKQHTRQINMRFTANDADILARLDSVQNKQGYIKALIREDIARNPEPAQNSQSHAGAKRLDHVRCDCTGGGIWVYSALFNGEVWLYGGLDNYFGSYDIPGAEIEEDGCDYDSHVKYPSVPFPTWREILESIRESCDDSTIEQAEKAIKYFNPDMNAHCIEE